MYAIIVSSLIYLSAFIYPTYLYVGVFVFMIPLIVTHNTLGFKEGYTWGLLFFGGHFMWLASIVYNQGQGVMRMGAYFGLVAYFSLYSGFWLWFKQLLDGYVSRIQNHNGKCVASCCTWVISTVTFICLTCYCSMALFDCFEGYPLINPLLPLVSWSWYLEPIVYLGTFSYWIIIVFVNVSIVSLYKKFDIKTLIFLMMLLGFPALFYRYSEKIIVKKDGIFYLQPTWNDRKFTPHQIFDAIGKQIDQLAMQHSNIKFVFIPESGFPCNLLHWGKKLDRWTSLLPDTTTIFIGAHRYHEGKVFNSLYQIQDGKIVQMYDKEHLMVCVERIPRWLSISSGLFTTDDCVFSYPMHDQSNLIMAGFQPIICSELFYEKKKVVRGVPILFVCNDSWLSLDYAQQLGKRSARLCSLQYRLPIVYVGAYDWEIIQ